jgi:hypothetical protein
MSGAKARLVRCGLTSGEAIANKGRQHMEECGMLKRIGMAALLGLALAAPAHEAMAQDTLGGALFGGAAGAIVGGALGGGRGAAIGAVLGAGTGAAIASEGERRRAGYYYYRNGCYLQRPDGYWVRVDPRYCY